ncbi:MAG: SpoIIE family protein phosphatase [Acidobacteriales bacterium]|nr:SpoIIE family protein phosphatase [Terriglobales bacterium]
MPTSKLGRLALYFLILRLGLALVQVTLLWFGRTQTAKSLEGWAIWLSIVTGVLLTIVLLRWIRREFMWRLRNRLLVTYIFIGVIPVVLIVSMVLIAGTLVLDQYATSQIQQELDAEVRGLDLLNSHFATEISARLRAAATPDERMLAGITDRGYLSQRFPGLRLSLWHNGKRAADHTLTGTEASAISDLPAWIKGPFRGLVVEGGRFHMVSANVVWRGAEEWIILTSVPVSKEIMDRAALQLGEARLHVGQRMTKGAERQQGIKVRSSDAATGENVNYQFSGRPSVIGGTTPAKGRYWDPAFNYGTVTTPKDWKTGEDTIAALSISTRPSALVNRLFAQTGQLAPIFLGALVAIAVVFAVIEIVAVFFGIGLTRTVTKSVYNLYQATQHINRGDLKHRIAVESDDQLAELQKSFNSMAGSLEKLLAEQKEKERLENELAIAQEVQATLFPREIADLRSLELHGVCRPARTVSGDYYDFLPYHAGTGQEKLSLALGDISGKGISAALLMATLHSAVRVYEFGRMPTRQEFVRAGAAAIAGAAHVSREGPRELLLAEGMHSPSHVIELLNRHLFHSTQPEKYATLFLGIYDGQARSMTYTNAGHLPPILVGDDGSVRRLETGGTVIGLFDNMTYEESVIQIRPGDIFVAYSDGVTEPENEFGEFGEQRLIEIIHEHRHLPLPRISEQVISAVQDWIGSAEQPDDITLVLARTR